MPAPGIITYRGGRVVSGGMVSTNAGPNLTAAAAAMAAISASGPPASLMVADLEFCMYVGGCPILI